MSKLDPAPYPFLHTLQEIYDQEDIQTYKIRRRAGTPDMKWADKEKDMSTMTAEEVAKKTFSIAPDFEVLQQAMQYWVDTHLVVPDGPRLTVRAIAAQPRSMEFMIEIEEEGLEDYLIGENELLENKVVMGSNTLRRCVQALSRGENNAELISDIALVLNMMDLGEQGDPGDTGDKGEATSSIHQLEPDGGARGVRRADFSR